MAEANFNVNRNRTFSSAVKNLTRKAALINLQCNAVAAFAAVSPDDGRLVSAGFPQGFNNAMDFIGYELADANMDQLTRYLQSLTGVLPTLLARPSQDLDYLLERLVVVSNAAHEATDLALG